MSGVNRRNDVATFKVVKRQFYNVFARGITLHIDCRYRNIVPIGSGSYGIVCSAVDSVTGMKVAIKISIIYNRQTLEELRDIREVKYLRFFHDCPYILDIIDFYCYPYVSSANLERYTRGMRYIYMVTPLYDYDLESVIDASNYLSIDQVRLILYQVLLAARYIHSAGFIHRDIKPGNILINKNADVVLCDFGLSRADEANLTPYVVTRNYRAPELLAGNKNYTNKIDIWAIGIVLAEMLKGALFINSSNANNALEFILSFTGGLTDEDLEMIENEKLRRMIQTMEVDYMPISQILSREVPPVALDLLTKLLVFNPAKRPTAEEALSHPFFADLGSVLPPIHCIDRYSLEWELQVLQTRSKAQLGGEFLREQEYYPLVKCCYSSK